MATVAQLTGSAPQDVDESLRWDWTAQTLFRTTTCQVDVAGFSIPEGAKILLFLAAANRDPRKWAQPHDFAIDRASYGPCRLWLWRSPVPWTDGGATGSRMRAGGAITAHQIDQADWASGAPPEQHTPCHAVHCRPRSSRLEALLSVSGSQKLPSINRIEATTAVHF